MFDKYHDVMTVEEVCDALRIGYNSAYKLLNNGSIKALRNGRSWLIPKACLIEYVETSSGISNSAKTTVKSTKPKKSASKKNK